MKKLIFPRRDLTGKVFGRLTVLKFSQYKMAPNRRKDYWKVKCECGETKEVQGNSLVTGGVSSCGCLLKEHYATLPEKARIRNSLPKGEASFNLILSNYKDRARKKKLAFDLTTEEFKSFLLANCEYCGNKPSNICKKKKSNGEFIYNGIDRLNNNEGYSKINCITACEICNKAKRDLTIKEFTTWIANLTQSNGWKKFIKVKS